VLQCNYLYFLSDPLNGKKNFDLINTEKDASRTKAIEIFPKISHYLSKKKDSNKADAILIACFHEKTIKTTN